PREAPAGIRPRPGTELSFACTRVAIGRAGRGLQEADVEHRRMADGTVITAYRDPNDLNDKSDRVAKEAEVREIREVRATDLEPYTGLRYLSKLFKFMAVVMLLLLVAEIATGVYTQGSGAIPTLLREASRLIVLAGV